MFALLVGAVLCVVLAYIGGHIVGRSQGYAAGSTQQWDTVRSELAATEREWARLANEGHAARAVELPGVRIVCRMFGV